MKIAIIIPIHRFRVNNHKTNYLREGFYEPKTLKEKKVLVKVRKVILLCKYFW